MIVDDYGKMIDFWDMEEIPIKAKNKKVNRKMKIDIIDIYEKEKQEREEFYGERY